MADIVGNKVKPSTDIKIGFIGAIIVIQDYDFVYSGNYNLWEYNQGKINQYIHRNYFESRTNLQFIGTVPAKRKPIYHCYLILDVPIFSKPITIWSQQYVNKKSVEEMIDICNNSTTAILKTASKTKTTIMAEVMAKFKMKYGSEIIPIRIVDYKFAIKKRLPYFDGFYGRKHKNNYNYYF